MNAMNFLIAIAPLLLLLTALMLKRYPGEAAIERIRILLEIASSTHLRKLPHGGRLPTFQVTVRGGRLIACSLAGRAPPVPSAV
ncbi:MAG: hypothetical protein ACSLFI_08145 [Solirubrobacterales bacterium]